MKADKYPNPPKWADVFLEWYCNPRLLEQIQGDLHELFHWRVAEKGNFNAKKAFVWDVLRFFRWRNIKRTKTQKQQNNNMGKLKNYFKIGWRSLLNQKVTSVINIFGLSCAIACCIVAYLHIESSWFRGMYHENRDEIYLLTHFAESDAKVQRYGYMSAPIADLLKEGYSSVRRSVRVNPAYFNINYKGQTVSEESVHFVDPDFMDMFTYHIELGSKDILRNPGEVVITHRTAEKYFGTEYPIGKEIDMMLHGEKKIFTIGAVIRDLPTSSMLNFDILVNYTHYSGAYTSQSVNQQWSDTPWIFVEVEQNQLSNLVAGLDKLVKIQNEINPDRKYLEIALEPFSALVSQGDQIRSGPFSKTGMAIAPQILLASIAIFMLILAVFNYINIAILMATRRIKEIGVRKVIGGNRMQLIVQFLCENFIICFFALVLGGILAYAVILPWFNDLASVNLQMYPLHNYYLLAFLGILLLFITVVSGAYPAFFISSFKPAAIFSGKQRIGSKSRFTSVLLSFQFALAMITIVAGISFIQTNETNEKRDWGYDNSSKIVVNLPTVEDYRSLKDQLLQYSDVVEVAGSRHQIGNWPGNEEVSYNGGKYEVTIISGDFNYPELMGLRLSQGRLFTPGLAGDSTSAIVVNQTFMNHLGFSFPTEEQIVLNESKYNIIGVVEDFHYNNFSNDIEPAILTVTSESDFNYLTIKVKPATEAEMAPLVKKLWHDQIDNELYQGYKQSASFDHYFGEMNGVRNVLLFTATLAILLSAMGLFGLVSLNVSARIKDFGIRKVLGASLIQLSGIIYKRFLLLWIAGGIVGGGLAFLLVSSLLDMIYVFHEAVGIIPLISALVILLMVTILTVGSQALKVNNTNPVDTLKIE